MTNKKNKLTKRIIRAHKGGRTCHIPTGRITPATRDALHAELERLGLSFSDWLTEIIHPAEMARPE